MSPYVIVVVIQTPTLMMTTSGGMSLENMAPTRKCSTACEEKGKEAVIEI